MRYQLLFLVLLSITVGAFAEEPPPVVRDQTDLGVPYQRYTTRDSLGRTITFYLSIAPADKPEAKLPIVLWIQGSGCQSLFTKVGDKIGVGIQGLILAEAKGRVRVLAVGNPMQKAETTCPSFLATRFAGKLLGAEWVAFSQRET